MPSRAGSGSPMAADIPWYYQTGARHFHYMHVPTGLWGTWRINQYLMGRLLWNVAAAFGPFQVMLAVIQNGEQFRPPDLLSYSAGAVCDAMLPTLGSGVQDLLETAPNQEVESLTTLTIIGIMCINADMFT